MRLAIKLSSTSAHTPPELGTSSSRKKSILIYGPSVLLESKFPVLSQNMSPDSVYLLMSPDSVP